MPSSFSLLIMVLHKITRLHNLAHITGYKTFGYVEAHWNIVSVIFGQRTSRQTFNQVIGISGTNVNSVVNMIQDIMESCWKGGTNTHKDPLFQFFTLRSYTVECLLPAHKYNLFLLQLYSINSIEQWFFYKCHSVCWNRPFLKAY